jgi:phosphoribosylformylglycinamidine cyclo-ligase
MDLPILFQLIQQHSGTAWKEMYQVFNMGHRLELYLSEKHAQTVIDIAETFNVKAKIVGRVEADDKASLEIHHQGDKLIYNK